MLTVAPTSRPACAAVLAPSKSGPGSSARSQAASGDSVASPAGYDCFVLGTEVQGDDDHSQRHRPFHENMVRGYTIENRPLSKQLGFCRLQVPQGLSQLSRTASGNHTAYLRLELTGTDLDNPQHIAHCQCLQHIALNDNQLTTLGALGQLHHLASLDVSHNRLTQVLDFSNTNGCSGRHDSFDTDTSNSTNLRIADLSYNLIQEVRNLSGFKRLTKLSLDGNQIERIGSGLQQLHSLQHLSLSGNRISSCRGLEALTSLRTLALDGNTVSSLAPLAGLTGLEVLQVATNQLRDCAGIQGLSSLRRVDLRCNQLRRLEVLAPCQGLSLLGDLDVAGNPLEASRNIRLYLISLLPQVCTLNGATVSYTEKVDAANMAGAAAEGLMAIRQHYFPAGELDDGGGAVPPTAAGLVASRAEEELSCDNVEAMFEAIDAWATAVHPSTALATVAVAASGSGAAAPAGRSSADTTASAPGTPGRTTPTACGRLTRRSASSIARNSSASGRLSAAGGRANAVGVAAVAAKLGAGCSKSAPWAQLQLARACYSWVVGHVRLPQGCSAEAGADMHTWDVGMHLFGEGEQQVQWHQVLLQGHSGTYAECVSQLLVQLYHAVQMEAVQLSGFWKAGGQQSVGPGDRLAAQNHSWVAVKVNGRWRLLDPVYAILRQGQLPFYLPPEAFIYTHLPFEAYWQLLPNPVSRDQWWNMPELALPFFAVGGQLQDDQLRSCTLLPAVREGQVLPSLRIPILAPADEHQYVCLKLLDQHRQLLASWNNSTKQQQQQQTQYSCNPGAPLVFQQHMLDAGGQQQVLVGHMQKTVSPQELWVSLPAPGTYYAHVELVSETPNWLQLLVAGLADPLQVSYWQKEDVMRLKVVVPPVEPHDPADGICVSPATTVVALPQPEQGFHSCGGFQLLSPQPSKPLEADRPELFEVIAPAAEAVAVGCYELGWQVLQPGEVAAARPSSARQPGQQQLRLFTGTVVMPRAERCFVAVQLVDHGQQGQGEPISNCRSRWLPVISLQVLPQVQHIVAVPDPDPLSEPDPMDPVVPRLKKLLTGLDVDGDGVASRKDVLLAFRRDRQLADHLRMTPKVKVDDGSYDKFVAKFISINRDGLGYIDLKQLYAYMASISNDVSMSSRIGTAAAGSRLGSASPTSRSPMIDSANHIMAQQQPASRLAAQSLAE